jgi:predicted nucleotidyltransferase
MNYIEYTWERQRDIRCVFPVCVECDGINVQYIHPLQQKRAVAINRALQNDKRVVSIVLFGSSVNLRCNIHSDLDVVVRLKDDSITRENKNDVSEIIQECCDWNADVLWYDLLDRKGHIYNDVLKGVRIV